MLIGIVEGKARKSFPGGKGSCPACGGEIIAKCGDIKIWHWAHKQNPDCVGNGHEPETLWHRTWKSLVPIDWCERLININGQMRQADILKPTTTPIIYELQHSYISPEEIRNREEFYLKSAKCGLIWVFDIRTGVIWQSGEKEGNDRFHFEPLQALPGDDILFYWENGRTSILFTTAKTYLDLGFVRTGMGESFNAMIRVHSFSNSGKFSGSGTIITKKMFAEDEFMFYLSPIGWNDPGDTYENIIGFEYA